MECKYNVDIDSETVEANLRRLQSQIFKLLPMREEGKDCEKPLETISLELLGMQELFPDKADLISLVCKLEGLKVCLKEDNFQFYRRTIFECCGLIDKIKSQCS